MKIRHRFGYVLHVEHMPSMAYVTRAGRTVAVGTYQQCIAFLEARGI